MIKIATKSALIGLLCLLCWSRASLALEAKVGILQITEHPALNQTRAGLRDALRDAGLDVTDPSRWQLESAQGNNALAIQGAQRLVSNQVDVLVAISTTAAQIGLSIAKRHHIPVVYTSVTDPSAAKLLPGARRNRLGRSPG